MLRALSIAVALIFVADAAWAQPPAACPGTSTPLDISAGYAPFARMRLGDRDGNFIIDTGTNFSAVNSAFFGLTPGTEIMLGGSSLPTIGAGTFKVLDFGAHSSPPGGFGGLIGADLLANRVATFRYDSPAPDLIISTQPCPATQLEQAGFIPISMNGYNAADAAGIRSLWSGQPTIFIRIGSIFAAIGIDTGHTEIGPGLRPGTLQINEALFQRLRAAGIVMQRGRPIASVNCRGEIAERAIWRVMDAPLLFATETGRELFRYQPPMLEVFSTDSVCGTIEASSTPFGLVGALYLKLWGELVVDPQNQRVFVSPQRAAPIYKAVSVAWNPLGSWDLHSDESVEKANAGAVDKCNAQYGNCALAPVSFDPRSFQCLAIARNFDRRERLSLTKGGSLAEVRRSAVETCVKTYGGSCKLEYAICNG